jgi:hypothetical protein
VTWMKFRVAFDLRPGVRAAAGVTEEKFSCATRPVADLQTVTAQTTARAAIASEHVNPEKKK